MCEVGDSVSIPELISTGGNTGGWRGRAQQIQILQQRVTELSERLRKYSDHRLLGNACLNLAFNIFEICSLRQFQLIAISVEHCTF